MEKQYYRIKDIASIKSGKRLPAGHLFSDEPTSHPYIRSRDIKNGRILSSNLAYLEEETFQFIKKYIIEEGDVAITIVANIGDIGYCDTDCDKFNLTENAVRLTKFNQKIVDSQYLAFYLGQPFMKQYMESLAAGAAQAKLGIYKIEKIKVPLPKIEYQRRIASILSAYDNLIENNNRRIRLLEQMAENLYKEWFVRFRFPGHEKVEMENGLPKGWKISRVFDYGRIETGKTPPMNKQEYYGGDFLFIKTPDMHGNMFVKETEETLSERGSQSQHKKLLPIGSIMVSCIGSGGVVAINAKPGHTNQQINSIILSDIENLEWLYFTCKSLKPMIELFGATGATMTNLSKGKFEKLKIIEPPKSLRKAYHIQTKSIFSAILRLDEQNQLLTRQRDLLLPRLMSGKLEVNA